MNAQTELPDAPQDISLLCQCRQSACSVPRVGDFYTDRRAQLADEASGGQLELTVFAGNLLQKHVSAFRFGLVCLGLVRDGNCAVIRLRVDGFADWIELPLEPRNPDLPAHSAALDPFERGHECVRLVLVDACIQTVKASRLILISSHLSRSLRTCRAPAENALIVEFATSLSVQ